jgi:response regulator NasT
MVFSSDNLARPAIISTNPNRRRTIYKTGTSLFGVMPGIGRCNMSDNGSVPIRIAVAEDEPDVRRTFVRLLECLGHKVVCSVANGEELIDQCRYEEVDIAFVDLDMPVVDGLAAAEIVSERGIPVILVSGHPDARQVVVEREPVVARIVKPATIDALKRAIEQAMASRTA